MNNSSYKFYNIDEMDRLFLRHKLPKLTQEEMEKLKIIISIKGIKFIVTDRSWASDLTTLNLSFLLCKQGGTNGYSTRQRVSG